MIKVIIKLIWHRKGLRSWQKEIGAYLLKKGCRVELGQVLKSKTLGNNKNRKVKYVKGLSYDFETNKIYVRKGNTVIKS